jgi:hypothetical protein
VTSGVFSWNESGSLMYVLIASIGDTGQGPCSLLMRISGVLNS